MEARCNKKTLKLSKLLKKYFKNCVLVHSDTGTSNLLRSTPTLRGEKSKVILPIAVLNKNSSPSRQKRSQTLEATSKGRDLLYRVKILQDAKSQILLSKRPLIYYCVVLPPASNCCFELKRGILNAHTLSITLNNLIT